MQQVEGWPSDVRVTAPDHVVLVNGDLVKSADYSVSASTTGPVPGASAVVARTGGFVLPASDDSVFTAQRSPWKSGSVPAQGDLIKVQAGYDGVRAPIFEGTVDKVDGAVPGDVNVEVVDGFDRLRRKISIEPLMPKMPAYMDGGAFRNIAITPTYFTDRVLRHCGFYATPPRRNGNIFSAPLMGSSWPEYGQLVNSFQLDNEAGYPDFVETPWGQGVRGMSIAYLPQEHSPVNRDYEFTFGVSGAGSSGNQTLAISWGTLQIRTRIFYNRAVDVQIFDGASLIPVGALSESEMGGATWVTVRVTPAGAWTITNDAGVTKNTTAALPSGMVGSPITGIAVYGPLTAPAIGGLLVGVYGATDPIRSFSPSAILTPAAFPGTLGGSPAINDRSCADLLVEQAQAELASWWIDERARFVWKNRERFVTGSSVATVAAKQSLLGYAWEYDTSGTYSTVAVKYRHPRTRVTPTSTITVWQGNGQALDAGEVDEQIVHPEADEDWVMVDTTYEMVGRDDHAGYNRGRRTWVGAIRINEDQIERDASSYLTVDYEQLDYSSYLFRHTVSSSVPATDTVVLRTAGEAGVGMNIWPTWRNQNLPFLRSYGRINWQDRKVTSTTFGNSELPALEIDAKWWVQHQTAVDGLCDYAATRFTTPTPRIKTVRIVPDARIQLGDIITITDPTYSQVTLKCAVLGWDISGGDGWQDMSLSVFIIDSVRTSVSYAELDAVWAGMTYADFDSAWAGKTYDELDANPLEVTP